MDGVQKLVWGETDAFERVCLSLLDMEMRGLGVELCMIIGLVHVRIRVRLVFDDTLVYVHTELSHLGDKERIANVEMLTSHLISHIS